MNAAPTDPSATQGTHAERLATFAVRASYDMMSAEAREQMKIRVLDSLGCAIGALDADPIKRIRRYIDDMGQDGPCSLLGMARRTTPDRAAFHNSALVRYLDFNDSYMSAGDYAHPSDNFGPVLAAGEFAGAHGRDFLAALALAYQVQTRLVDVAPVLDKGFDHTVQGSYAVAAGVSRMLGLNVPRTANAIAMAGTAFNALRVTRTGRLSHWKGLAYANTAFGCLHAAMLARQGITGPSEVFEGNKGFMHTIAGCFEIDWEKEDLEAVTRTSIKKYNGTIDAQSSIETALALRARLGDDVANIRSLELDVFDIAFRVIGGGEEGDKHIVSTKEEADHSLPYMVAVALLDGVMMPAQYASDRLARPDVQALLRRVSVRSDRAFSDRFPDEVGSRLRAVLEDGREARAESRDYEGYRSRPMGWVATTSKFEALASPRLREGGAAAIVDSVRRLDGMDVATFFAVLNDAIAPDGAGR